MFTQISWRPCLLVESTIHLFPDFSREFVFAPETPQRSRVGQKSRNLETNVQMRNIFILRNIAWEARHQ